MNQLFGNLRERMIDLRAGKTIFIGGGAILLREFIESSKKLGGTIIIDDTFDEGHPLPDLTETMYEEMYASETAYYLRMLLQRDRLHHGNDADRCSFPVQSCDPNDSGTNGGQQMNFRDLLLKAKSGDEQAIEELIRMYQPLIIKDSSGTPAWEVDRAEKNFSSMDMKDILLYLESHPEEKNKLLAGMIAEENT